MTTPADRLTKGKQPRHFGIVHKGQMRLQPPNPKEKPYRLWTWTEHWLDRRRRWLSVMPIRLSVINEALNGIIQCANQETYEFTEDEAAGLVAHLRARVDALEQALQAREVIYPSDLLPYTVDHSLEPAPDAIEAPADLEEIW